MPSVSKEIWIFSGIIFVLLVLGVCMQLFVFQQKPISEVPFDMSDDAVVSEGNEYVPYKPLPVIKDVDSYGSFFMDLETSWRTYYDVLPKELALTAHSVPKKLSTDAIHAMIDPATLAAVSSLFCGNDQEPWQWQCFVYVYEMGTIVDEPTWGGRPLYMFVVPESGMGITYTVMHVVYDVDVRKFILLDGRLVESLETYDMSDLQRNPFPYLSGPEHAMVYQQFIIGSSLTRVNGLPPEDSLPQTIQFGENGSLQLSDYEYKERVFGERRPWFSSKTFYNNAYGILDVTTGERNAPLSNLSKTNSVDPQWGQIFFDRYTFVIEGKGGARGLYEFIPYFLSAPQSQEQKDMYPSQYTPEINWVDGYSVGSDGFTLGGVISATGCHQGVVPLSNIVNSAPWFDPQKLRQIGTTKEKSEPIYVPTDVQTNQYYKDLFEFGYSGSQLYGGENFEERQKQLETMSEEEKYAQFLLDNPVFIWKDTMGNWRVYHKAKYQSMAECGKPVIYLYPEQTTDVNVQVAPNGGFTETIPQYPNGGWNVRAEPNGALTSYDDGQPYPYLFWEGHANGFGYSDKGFVFAQSEVESGMKDVLTRFGMNETETADFLEFWLPKMVEKPYVFVTFADQREFERAAPLKITPKPDSVLRVFMYFEGLGAPRTVEPLTIRPFVRKGFSVVEWGGVLQK